MDEIKKCPYQYCGCISQGRGNSCLHEGPCDPCDDRGRKFKVFYEAIQGQRMMFREFAHTRAIIDAEIANAALALVAEIRS